MIEVDVFWSFAIGAACACAASSQLSDVKHNKSAFTNVYFAYTVFVLSCVFSPSGSYLLIAFPGWESMFVLNRKIINDNPMLITIFHSTNTLLGIIGFYLVWSKLHTNSNASNEEIDISKQLVKIHRYWIWPYLIMFAILGFGYSRFLYPSTFDEYNNNVIYPLYSFFQCKVFYTLLIMGILLIPLLYYPWYYWSKFNSQQLSNIRSFIVKEIFDILCIMCIGYLLFIHGYCDKEMREYFRDDRIKWAGIYAPMVAFLVLTNSLFLLAIVPIFTVTAVNVNVAKKHE